MRVVSRPVAAVAVVLLVLLGGCAVSQPDVDAWRDHAAQTLEDAGSEVATARLTLTQLAEGRLQASYGVTVLAEAEKGIGTAEEGLASLQPPPGMRSRADRLLAVIGHAVDAVQRAREAAVSGRFEQPTLVAELDRLRTVLDERRAAL